MILPDLQKELAYWQDALNLRDWKIQIRYIDDPRDPATGASVWGLCERISDNRTARIDIRTPRQESDIAEAYDTIVHELLHCLQAPAEAPRVVEENIVWTLAPLLTQLRLGDPSRAKVLIKALARPKTLLASQSRARAGGNMDPEKIKAIIAAIKEGNGEAALAVLEDLLATAAGGMADPPSDPAAPPKEDAPPAPPAAAPAETPKDTPKMGMSKDDKDPMYKQLAEQMAADRAAAVDGLLDTRPDLTPKQRTMLKEIGMEKGVAKAREALAELVPAPKASPADPKPSTLPKMGAPEIPRGGKGDTRAKVASSGDGKVDALFRVMPSDPENDGVEVPGDGTGVLVRFSVMNAYAKIKNAAEKARESQRARMGGTR